MNRFFTLLLAASCTLYVWGQVPTNVESAEFDPINDRWLVNNGNSVLYTEDLGSSWNTLGSAAANYGMEIIGTTLFAIHNNIIKSYDVTTGNPLGTHSPGNVAFLLGMGSQSDENGDVLVVSDFSSGKLIKIDVSDPANMSSSVLVANTGTTPSGVTLKDGLATVVNWGVNADILQVDVVTGAMTSLIDSPGIDNCYGIDWAGESWVVSSWSPNRVTLFTPHPEVPGVWTQETLATSSELSNPAGLSVNNLEDMYAVASSGDNTVFFGVLPESSVNQDNGCTDVNACNFDEAAVLDDGSCLYLDGCGVCGGQGIPVGACDCNGNVIDALGVCGGLCTVDNDNNGVCDDQEIYGCTYSQAENYLPEATRDDGSCLLGEGCNPVCDLEYDGNGDGSVGSGDLLGLLTEFGAECTPETAFSCGNPVSYQGYDYETVQIGDQCWFAENLRNENYANGETIPANLSVSQWESTTSGAVAVYGEGELACISFSPDGDACDEGWSLSEYGRLYNWYAVDDARGLCPSGWHVPADEEFMQLIDYLGGPSVAGGHMKTSYGWQFGINGDGNGSNSSGFSGLPGGYRNIIYGTWGYFTNVGGQGCFWSSTSSPDLDLAHSRYLQDVDEQFLFVYNSKNFGFSVRCLKD